MTVNKTGFDELLELLLSGDEMPSVAELSVLSDLTVEEMARVRSVWSMIPEEKRFRTVESLVRVSEENLHLILGRFLRIAMEDDSPRVRVQAIHGLWDDDSEDLIGPLIHLLLNDPEGDVRAAAAGALGSYVLAGELEELDVSYAMRVEEALLAVLHSDTEPLDVQTRALESIAFSGEVGIRQLIEDAYYSPYEEMQVSALRAMGRSADVRWRAAVRTELENGSAEMRAAAAVAAGELDARAARAELLSLLDDPSQDVRLSAIFALGRVGGREAKEALRLVSESEMTLEAEAAEEALEEALFFDELHEMSLLDESAAEWGEDLDDLDDL